MTSPLVLIQRRVHFTRPTEPIYTQHEPRTSIESTASLTPGAMSTSKKYVTKYAANGTTYSMRMHRARTPNPSRRHPFLGRSLYTLQQEQSPKTCYCDHGDSLE
jgi:hypothetical protein